MADSEIDGDRDDAPSNESANHEATEILRLLVHEAATPDILGAMLLRAGERLVPVAHPRILVDAREVQSRSAFLGTLDLIFQARLLLGPGTHVAVVTALSADVPNPRGFFELFGAPRGTIAHFWSVEDAERWLGEAG